MAKGHTTSLQNKECPQVLPHYQLYQYPLIMITNIPYVQTILLFGSVIFDSISLLYIDRSCNFKNSPLGLEINSVYRSSRSYLAII